jgi:hypothetical protein
VDFFAVFGQRGAPESLVQRLISVVATGFSGCGTAKKSLINSSISRKDDASSYCVSRNFLVSLAVRARCSFKLQALALWPSCWLTGTRQFSVSFRNHGHTIHQAMMPFRKDGTTSHLGSKDGRYHLSSRNGSPRTLGR